MMRRIGKNLQIAACYFAAALYTAMILLYVLFADSYAKQKTINAICLLIETDDVDKAFDSIYLVSVCIDVIFKLQ